MIDFDIAQSLREQIADGIDIERESDQRLLIEMPFVFDDGDHFSFHATRDANGKWMLSDDGDVLQRASDAGLNLSELAQRDRLNSIIEFYGVNEKDGALDMEAPVESFASSLFTFTQTCLEATWLTKMLRARHQRSDKTGFTRKLERLVTKAVGQDRVVKNWFDKAADPKKLYTVDYNISGRQRQLFLFGVSSEISCAQATITCLHYKTLNYDFESVVVYEDESRIRPKYADRLKDVVDRKFPSVTPKSITRYLANLAT